MTRAQDITHALHSVARALPRGVDKTQSTHESTCAEHSHFREHSYDEHGTAIGSAPGSTYPHHSTSPGQRTNVPQQTQANPVATAAPLSTRRVSAGIPTEFRRRKCGCKPFRRPPSASLDPTDIFCRPESLSLFGTSLRYRIKIKRNAYMKF